MTVTKIFEHLNYNKTSWREQAACKNESPSLFFAEKNDKSFHKAIKICNNCPVRQECLDYAIQIPERLGIWGGLGYRGRLKYAKKNNILRNQ